MKSPENNILHVIFWGTIYSYNTFQKELLRADEKTYRNERTVQALRSWIGSKAPNVKTGHGGITCKSKLEV